MKLGLITKIFLLIFSYLLVYFLFVGLTTQPSEGDSIGYHIPIARSILSGKFTVYPETFLHFYPSASEAILSIFILVGIPLNLYNLLAWVILAISCYSLGSVFGLRKNLALIFAFSVCSLPVIVRWVPTQIIDIWLVNFFILGWVFLEKPEKTRKHYFALGFFLGMLFGSKYSGPLFSLVLIIFYSKRLLKNLSIQRFTAFVVPFFTFGVLWYIRNFLLTKNPFYPLTFLYFRGDPNWPSNLLTVWQAVIYHPKEMLDAIMGEYLLWPFFILITLMIYIKRHKVGILLGVGILNFIIYLFLPSFEKYNVMVSNFRFSYPSFIPLILGVFLAAAKFKKERELSFLALTNMVVLSQLSYHPKLLLLMLPIILFVIEYSDGKEKDIYWN